MKRRGPDNDRANEARGCLSPGGARRLKHAVILLAAIAGAGVGLGSAILGNLIFQDASPRAAAVERTR